MEILAKLFFSIILPRNVYCGSFEKLHDFMAVSLLNALAVMSRRSWNAPIYGDPIFNYFVAKNQWSKKIFKKSSKVGHPNV